MNEKVKPRKKNNPLYTLLILAFLVTGYFGILRLGVAVRDWGVLATTLKSPSPTYFAVSGGLWALAALLSAFGLMLRRRWAPYWAMIAVLLMTAGWWFEKLVLTVSETARTNFPFAMGLSLVIILFTFITLVVFSQSRGFDS